LVSGCVCSSGQKSVTCEYIITYTQNDILKTSRINKTIECVTESVPINVNVVVQPVVEGVVLEDGTLENPWIINNCLELQDMNNHLDGNYILGADINCYNDTHSGGALWNEGLGFRPIATTIGGRWCNGKTFSGSFNGANHSIDGLYIGPDFVFSGLFGCSSGSISNVRLTNVDLGFSPVGRAGALIGYNTGSVSNCSSTGSLYNYDSGSYAGGLIGYSTGPISNSFSTVNVSGDEDWPGSYWGGLVGYSSGPITGSYSTGNVTNAHDYVGGLVGYSASSITDSNSTSNVNSEYDYGPPNYIGGLVGYSSGTISRCFSTGSVSGANSENVGGLVGYSSAAISDSYSTSWLGGVWGYGGGLVGYSASPGSITNSYAIPPSTAWLSGYVGGLVGKNEGNITNSYSAGKIYGLATVGGLVGLNSSGIISNSYSDTNVNCSALSGCTNSTIGGLVSTFSEGTLSNNWWYNYRTNCCGSGTCTNCTRAAGVDSFIPKAALGNDYNKPIQHNTLSANDWNFVSNWKNIDNNYPILAWQND